LIIVEGPDGAGKSTLVSELSGLYGLQVFTKNGPAPRDLLRGRVYSAVGNAVEGRKPVRIYDRLFFSELIYAPILRSNEPPAFHVREERYLLDVLAAMKCPVIFCLPSLEQVRHNVLKSEHLEGVKENIHHIYNRYCTFYHDFAGCKMMYDYNNGLKNWDPIDHYIVTRRLRTWA